VRATMVSPHRTELVARAGTAIRPVKETASGVSTRGAGARVGSVRVGDDPPLPKSLGIRHAQLSVGEWVSGAGQRQRPVCDGPTAVSSAESQVHGGIVAEERQRNALQAGQPLQCERGCAV